MKAKMSQCHNVMILTHFQELVFVDKCTIQSIQTLVIVSFETNSLKCRQSDKYWNDWREYYAAVFVVWHSGYIKKDNVRYDRIIVDWD